MRRTVGSWGLLLVVASVAPFASAGGITPTVDPKLKAIVRKAPECEPLVKDGGSTNLWDAVKHPALKQHCDELIAAWDLLHRAAPSWRDALERIRIAERYKPNQPGTRVLEGLARAADDTRDSSASALESFEKARTLSAMALEDIEVLDAYGAALLRTGKLDEARAVYRRLLPRAIGSEGFCATKIECEPAAIAYWTAGMLALDAGPAKVDEAIAILREARRHSPPATDVLRMSGFALALALDRRGDAEQAKSLVESVSAISVVPNEASATLLGRMPVADEVLAIRAFALESADPSFARSLFAKYVAAVGDKGVWATHAKRELGKLEKIAPAKKGKGP